MFPVTSLKESLGKWVHNEFIFLSISSTHDVKATNAYIYDVYAPIQVSQKCFVGSFDAR